MKILTYILITLTGIALFLVLAANLLIKEEVIVEKEVTVGEVREGEEVITLSLEGFSKLEKDDVSVYFKPPQQALAQEAAEALQDALDLISERIGVESKIAVALFPKEELEERFGDIKHKSFVLKVHVWPILVPRQWQSLQDVDHNFQRDLYWTMPHEAVEGVISWQLYRDRRARWVGDGLAEYSGYMIAKQQAHSVASERIDDLKRRVQALLDAGKETYDLTRDFPVRSGPLEETIGEVQRAGYGVALAFWLDLAQRHGERTIYNFWELLSLRKTWCLIPGLICHGPNAGSAAHILSKLTKEDIWSKIQRMDLKEVLKVLEQAS